MVGGRFLDMYTSIECLKLTLSVHISNFFNIVTFLEKLILLDFSHFYFSAKDISLNI